MGGFIMKWKGKGLWIFLGSLAVVALILMLVYTANRPIDETVAADLLGSSSSQTLESSSSAESSVSSPQVQAQAPASSKQENAHTQKQEEIVYVTKTGKKYHKAGCPHLKGKKNVTAMTKSEAIRLGYTACEDCKP